MSIESSLSFHNDTTWSLEHDKRVSEKLPKNVNPEDCKYNVYWSGNMTLEEFYDKYFEDAFQEYEKKKSKKDRFEGTYLEKISKISAEKEKVVRDLKNRHAPYKELRKANKYTKPAYQVVITIGNCDENPEFKHGGEKEDIAKEILTKYMNSFEKRNSGLKLVCGAVHCDEGDRFDADGNIEKVGGNIHLHITYVPVAKSERGQRIVNSLTKALSSMGIENDKTKDPVTGNFLTAQIKWQNREREYLSELCKEYDINIVAKGKGNEKHLAVDDYQRKKEIDYVNETKRQNQERSKQLDIREGTINAILEDNPSLSEIEGIINENIEVVQRNDELEKRENTNQDFIKSVREDYFSESSALWDERKKEKEKLKQLIKKARDTKRFDEIEYKKLMKSIYYTNERFITKLFKLIYALLFRFKLKKEEQELQELVERNKAMKEKSKEIVEAGRNLTDALKTKDTNKVLEALENWDYAIGKVEDSIYHKLDLDFERERIKREEYEDRMSRRETYSDSSRNSVDFDDLR